MKDIKNRVIIPTIILALVTFISGWILSKVNEVTKPEIKKQDKQKEINALKMVLPGYTVDPIEDKKTVKIKTGSFTFWTGLKDKAKAYAFKASMPGYSGDVKSMVGITEKGKIIGISILQQTETPGLGARCQEIASSYSFFTYLFGDTSKIKEKTVPWFQKQFAGLHLTKKIKLLKKGDWNEKMKKALLEQNAISSITGATITSKVVLDSIKIGYSKLKTVLKKVSEKKEK